MTLTVAVEGPGGRISTVPDGETRKSLKSPKTTLGSSMLQDTALDVFTAACDSNVSLPSTDHAALTLKVKTATVDVDRPGTKLGFSPKRRRQGGNIQRQLIPTCAPPNI